MENRSPLLTNTMLLSVSMADLRHAHMQDKARRREARLAYEQAQAGRYATGPKTHKRNGCGRKAALSLVQALRALGMSNEDILALASDAQA